MKFQLKFKVTPPGENDSIVTSDRFIEAESREDAVWKSVQEILGICPGAKVEEAPLDVPMDCLWLKYRPRTRDTSFSRIVPTKGTGLLLKIIHDNPGKTRSDLESISKKFSYRDQWDLLQDLDLIQSDGGSRVGIVRQLGWKVLRRKFQGINGGDPKFFLSEKGSRIFSEMMNRVKTS